MPTVRWAEDFLRARAGREGQRRAVRSIGGGALVVRGRERGAERGGALGAGVGVDRDGLPGSIASGGEEGGIGPVRVHEPDTERRALAGEGNPEAVRRPARVTALAQGDLPGPVPVHDTDAVVPRDRGHLRSVHDLRARWRPVGLVFPVVDGLREIHRRSARSRLGVELPRIGHAARERDVITVWGPRGVPRAVAPAGLRLAIEVREVRSVSVHRVDAWRRLVVALGLAAEHRKSDLDAVRRPGRLTGFQIGDTLEDEDLTAPIGVHHPDVAVGASQSHEDDFLSVRRPGGVEVTHRVAGQLQLTCAVGVDRVDLGVAVLAADERDLAVMPGERGLRRRRQRERDQNHD